MRKRSNGQDLMERLISGSTFDPLTGCIRWNGSKLRGYGCIGINGKSKRVHVVAWEAANGPTPAGMELDHRCHSENLCGQGDMCPHRSATCNGGSPMSTAQEGDAR